MEGLVSADGRSGGSQAGSYLDHYHLAAAPFGLTSNPTFAYDSRGYATAFADAFRAVEDRTGIVVITGAAGTGKTMLCRALIERLGAHTLLSVVSAASAAADDLVGHISSDFGVSEGGPRHGSRAGDLDRATMSAAAVQAGERERIGMLRDALAPLVARGVHAIVLVEEAQQLDDRGLAQVHDLARLQSGSAKLVQILLVGDSHLEPRLQQFGKLSADGLMACRALLSRLGDDEVGPYIQHRLEVAGGTHGSVSFTPEAIDAVARLAGGVPRAVNVLCDRALAIGSARRMPSIDRAVILDAARSTGLTAAPPEKAMSWPMLAAASAAILVLIGLAAWWRIEVRQSGAPPAPVTTAPRDMGAAAGSPAAVNVVLPAADGVLLEVGVFATPGQATAVVRQIADHGLPAFTRRAGGQSLVVLVGPYVSRDEAVDAQRQVAALDFRDTRIVVERR